MDSNRTHWGHAHFWERALSRRKFLSAAALTGGAALTSPLWATKLVEAAAFAEADPRFIPGGTILPFQTTPFHFFFPTGGPSGVTVASGHGDPSLITDFDGMVGVADVGQNGGTSVLDGKRLLWKADVRFMKGTYIGTEGDTRSGAFAFV
jgi:hypothetical protein